MIKAVYERESSAINLCFGYLRCKSRQKAAVSRSDQQLVAETRQLLSVHLLLLQQTERQGNQSLWGFPHSCFTCVRQLNSFSSDCLKFCPGGPDPNMATSCLLLAKGKVKTAGSKEGRSLPFI